MKNQEKFCLVASIIIGALWCVLGITSHYSEGHAAYWMWPLLLAHIAFLIIFICLILFAYKAFVLKSKIAAEEKLKESEYKRKESWEQFQHSLNASAREARQKMEWEKWGNEDEKFHFELDTKRKDVEKFPDAEKEKLIRSFCLLSLGLSASDRTIEDKIKQIQKDYDSLKKAITNIKS